jgi:hypothetical protein
VPDDFTSAKALIGIFRGSLSPTLKAIVISRIAAIISITIPPVTPNNTTLLACFARRFAATEGARDAG